MNKNLNISNHIIFIIIVVIIITLLVLYFFSNRSANKVPKKAILVIQPVVYYDRSDVLFKNTKYLFS